jgi:hypothetical protein
MRTIEEILKDIDKYYNEPQKRCEFADEFVDELRDVFTIDRLQEICNAERDGRCVILPCKVGDTVYHDSGGFGILDYVVEGYAWNETGIIFQAASDSFGVDDIWECLDEIEFYESDIGKTVFLTREEAKQALKGGAK